MPGPINWTEEFVEKRLRTRGQGARQTFRPWLTVQMFSSFGSATRIPSFLFRRSIHTFSEIERNLYLFFEYAGDRLPTDSFEPESMRALEGKVTIEGRLWDWREQLPIPREVTLASAERNRIRHPRYPKTGVPMVMSIDAMAVFRGGSEAFIDGKTHTNLVDKRVMNKLRLHKAFAEYVQRPHYIFTEQSVPSRRLKNIDLVRSAMPKRGEIIEPRDLFSRHLDVVKNDILQGRRISISDFCLHYDTTNGLPRGTALRLVWCLVWNKNLRLDMEAEHLSELHVCKIRRGRS